MPLHRGDVNTGGAGVILILLNTKTSHILRGTLGRPTQLRSLLPTLPHCPSTPLKATRVMNKSYPYFRTVAVGLSLYFSYNTYIMLVIELC